MMTRMVQLETFDMPAASPRSGAAAQAELEEGRLAAYEQGYAAGWDDAIAAEKAEIARLRADLGRNLAEMSFTYRDARRHVLTALEPLLQEMVTKVLPSIAHQGLGHVILDELRPLAEAMTSAPVVVRTAQCNRAIVENLLASATDLPLRVVEEATLDAGQAYIKVGDRELKVDLDGVVTAIGNAVSSFFALEISEDRP